MARILLNGSTIGRSAATVAYPAATGGVVAAIARKGL